MKASYSVMHELATAATHQSKSASSESFTQPSLLQRARPNASKNSSNASSLTRENIKQHNALLASHEQITSSGFHNLIKFAANDSSSSVSTPNSSRGLETSTQADSYPIESAVESSPRLPHVHFRPRVRITSGINRHRHSRSLLAESDSSVSSSPSSSISAPLRSCTDDEADKPGWGPLGRRVALLSRQARCRSGRRERRRKREFNDDYLHPCEHTPLLRPRIQSPVIDVDGHTRLDDVFDSDPEEDARQFRARQIDEAFGTMPGRLLNYHWWWWQIEPLVCCRCLDESDVE
ncbi:hypothetical protein E4T56_gene18441 [Termitomyces sp. T112]|nr:hypothetical protein E4T56_gene18441 [Termitomyces sp. T112]